MLTGIDGWFQSKFKHPRGLSDLGFLFRELGRVCGCWDESESGTSHTFSSVCPTIYGG